MAIRYAILLADKLELDGEVRQANTLRTLIAKAPTASVHPATARLPTPTDDDSRLATVDFENPVSDAGLVLHPYAASRVESFLDSVRQFDRWQTRGIATPSRLLLVGPPGTGKTSVARRIAHNLSLPLVTTRSDTLVSSLLGQTSKNIREVFQFAERQPCVLFLDELDALAKTRSDAREIGELQRVVIALLQNIDALSPNTVLIAASNHEELLDSAVWRRFETTIRLGPPDTAQRSEIWRMHLHAVTISEHDVAVLTQYSEGLTGAHIRSAAYDIARDAILNDSDTVNLSHAMRRLAHLIWYESYETFTTSASEISALRAWAPSVFTVRVLAELFTVSTRKVSNAIKGVQDARVRPDSAGAI